MRATQIRFAPELDEEAFAAQEASRRAAANRRRMIQDKQRREEKESTVQKLLQKQTSSALRKDETRRAARKSRTLDDGHNALRYINSRDSATLSVPKGHEFPLAQRAAVPYPTPRPVCEVGGCTLPRRYAVLSSGQSVCGLAHYKALVAATGAG
jgi:hypothetical protein